MTRPWRYETSWTGPTFERWERGASPVNYAGPNDATTSARRFAGRASASGALAGGLLDNAVFRACLPVACRAGHGFGGVGWRSGARIGALKVDRVMAPSHRGPGPSCVGQSQEKSGLPRVAWGSSGQEWVKHPRTPPSKGGGCGERWPISGPIFPPGRLLSNPEGSSCPGTGDPSAATPGRIKPSQDGPGDFDLGRSGTRERGPAYPDGYLPHDPEVGTSTSIRYATPLLPSGWSDREPPRSLASLDVALVVPAGRRPRRRGTAA